MRTPLDMGDKSGLPLPKRSPVLPYVEVCRKILLSWFGRVGDLWSKIARALPPSAAGATLTRFEDLIANAYFTDCIKCITTKTDIGDHRSHCANYLGSEFALLKSAVLFISVSGEAWKTVQRIVGPLSPVQWEYQHLRNGLPTADSLVTEAHGVLFANPGTGKCVIPVRFPGGQTNALRNSYLAYLNEGLAAFAALKSQS